LASLVCLACTPSGPDVLALQGETMGSTWSVRVVLEGLDDQELQHAAVEAAILSQLDLVDRTMSTYREDSDISRLNGAPGGVPVPVPQELLEVLLLSRRVSEETGGAFDVTVGPLVEAWGFGPASGAPLPPSDDLLEELRPRIGYHLVKIDPETSTVVKARTDVAIDLNAIAPGYAVDRIAAELERLGLRRHLIDVGGEIRGAGLNADGVPWRIAIERPQTTRAAHRVVPLRDASLATSGDYRNFYVHEGRRFSHEIDPRTLRPVTHSLASVTVVHPSAAEADALATALIVLGPEAALELAERRNLAVLLLVLLDDGGIEERQSRDMRALLGVAGAEELS
jgi:FAD:protein FMN transferase